MNESFGVTDSLDEEGFVSVRKRQTSASPRESTVTPSSSEIETEGNKDDLMRILECPSCSETPIPPIRNCAQGHSICSSCIQFISTCTLCDSPITEGRNFAVEALVERAKFKCPFRAEGCPKKVLGKEYLQHRNECDFRPFLCNEPKCPSPTTKWNAEDYIQHLQSDHDAVALELSEKGFAIPQSLDEIGLSYVKFRGSWYILHTQRYKSFLCWWVSHIPGKDASEVKSATLTWAKNQAGDDSDVLKWTLPLHLEHESFEAIRDEGKCAVLPLLHMNQFRVADDVDDISWVLYLRFSVKQDERQRTAEDQCPWTTMQNLVPIILFLLAGLLMYIDTYDPKKNLTAWQGSSTEDYYGYRGFYFPVNQQ